MHKVDQFFPLTKMWQVEIGHKKSWWLRFGRLNTWVSVYASKALGLVPLFDDSESRGWTSRRGWLHHWQTCYWYASYCRLRLLNLFDTLIKTKNTPKESTFAHPEMVFLLEVPEGGISIVSLAAGCIPHLWHCKPRDRAQRLLWWRSGYGGVAGCCPDELVAFGVVSCSLCGNVLWTFRQRLWFFKYWFTSLTFAKSERRWMSGVRTKLLALKAREEFQLTPSNSCAILYTTSLFVGRFPSGDVLWIQLEDETCSLYWPPLAVDMFLLVGAVMVMCSRGGFLNYSASCMQLISQEISQASLGLLPFDSNMTDR